MEKTTIVLGLMSGTSLDGLDMALCAFNSEKNTKFKVLATRHVSFDSVWCQRLAEASKGSAFEYAKVDHDFGRWQGEQAKLFLEELKLNEKVVVAAHGHTVFHRPDLGFTSQIGNASQLAAASQCSVINDFRVLDVAMGGQGAPLVPIGDLELFGQYNACLNLGGFSNISFDWQYNRVAFDICPVNMIFNHFAEKLGKKFDADGMFASQGNVNIALLDQLNALPYYKQTFPKSLGREWFEEQFLPHFDSNIPFIDALATASAHVSTQIAEIINTYLAPSSRILCSGGGTYNQFLMHQIQMKLSSNRALVIPGNEVIDFKEAIIFAYLGFKRLFLQSNTLQSVTGARSAMSTGQMVWI